ncbi:hypothetical protein [Enterovirga aerilata]|uniref:Uncharacterized protein n=1 Tax=Enterovirga aerilata TaxID=2730920 RepID=A0A849IA75_9HYPH|nr:hypothetical protein [Enterovirga sp. DB1703]NNM74288.1 hypothetical protein [Enterovirga sp. DB1703]
MVRRTENLSHRGPVIRDLTVPERELELRPARLRPPRRPRRHLLARLYGTALLAWTLGLGAATTGLLLQNGGARSDAAAPQVPGTALAELLVPLPEPAALVWTERFAEPGPP